MILKKVLLALSSNEEKMESLMNFKYKTGRLSNLSFGDVYFLAMQDIYKDFAEAVKESQNI